MFFHAKSAARNLVLIITSLIISNVGPAQLLKVFITDDHSNEPLAYASAGIKKKNFGGIADRNGAIVIDLSTIHAEDSIIFSHIGYEPAIFLAGSLDPSKGLQAKLRRLAHELTDFVVTAKVNTYTLGNAKHSGRFTGLGDYSSSRGRARGLQVEPKEFPLKITQFVCRVKYNSFDSVRIRMNMFEKRSEGHEFKQLLRQNIYHTIQKKCEER